MRLPSGSIKRIFLYAIGAGIALGLVCYGLLDLVGRTLALDPPLTLLISLVIGGLLGMCLFLASRSALRLAAYDLRHTASKLTGQPLGIFMPSRGDDEFATLRSTFTRAFALLPDRGLHSTVAQAIAASPTDIGQRFDAAITTFVQDVPLRAAVLCVYNTEVEAFPIVSTWGLPPPHDQFELPADKGPLRRVALDQRDLVVSGSEARPILLALGLDEARLSVLCLPLLVANTLCGLLLLISTERDMTWSTQQRDPARGLANQLTMALSEEQVRQQIIHERQSLGALFELATALTTDLPFENALERMLRTAAEFTNSSHGTLLLLDDQEDVHHRIALTKGTLVPLQLVARSVLRSGLAGWALRERRPDIIADTQRDTRWLAFPGLDEMRSALVVPLTYGDRTLGILTLAHTMPQHYTEHMLHLVTALAAQVVHLIAHGQQKAAQLSDQQLIYAALLPHMSPTVLDELLQADHLSELARPRSAEVVVLAIGLGNMASVSEQLAPDVLFNAVLQPFANLVTAQIRDQGGYLDRCDSHGALAVFGYPQPIEDAAERALAVAQQLQTGLSDLRQHWRTSLRCTITFTIGVAAGNVSTGRASDDPLQGRYVVVGSAVNQAQRLQSLGRSGEVLCNAALNTAIGRRGTLTQGSALEALQPLPIGEGDEQLYRFTSAI